MVITMIDYNEIDKMTSAELVELYAKIIQSAKKRNLIRTKNFIGEIGESVVIEYYCNTPGLPNLQPAPVGTENIDAISRNGERYSIKTITTNTTSVFYGLPPKDSGLPYTQKFEYVVICSYSDDYELEAIYELTWDTFLKHKHWHSRMRAWNIVVTKAVIKDSKIIYKKDN